jgi:hypothetical protein
MAKRAKVKSKSAKSKRQPKKPVKVKINIGVASTIQMGPKLKAAFKAGLNNPNANIKYTPGISYGKNKLQKAIESYNNKVDWIVTAGGLVAYDAAEKHAKKPFLSLVGAAPTTPGSRCYGGVSLESYKSNPDRIKQLGKSGFKDLSKIGLFQNPNSAMQADEADEWTGVKSNIVSCSVDKNGEVNPSTYAADFDKFPDDVDAIVISADPFFQDTKDDLIAAANASGKYICYPLQTYENLSGNKPSSKKAVLYGPSLEASYLLLGQRVALALSTGKPVPFVSVLNESKSL